MTPKKLDKTEESSNVQGSWFDVKIISPDLPSDFSIENKEDKTEEILEEYSNKQTVEELNKRTGDLDKIRDNLFTLFGLFASVVAFLLEEVQILNNTCSKWMMIWLSLILLWSLSFFVLLIKFILSFRDDFDWKRDINIKSPICIVWLIALGLILIGIISASWWDEVKCKTENIIQQYEEILLNDLKRNFRFH